MSSSKPFCFVLPTGMFSHPNRSHFLTVHAAKVLTDYAASPDTPPGEAALLSAVLPLIKALPIGDDVLLTQDNDLQTPNTKRHKNSRWNREWASCHCAVLPTRPTPQFRPSDFGVAPDPSGWGWPELAALKPNLLAFSRLCEKLHITCNTGLLKRVTEAKKLFDQGSLSVRTPDAQNDLGQAPAWAVYSTRDNAFMDPKWSGCNLARAQLFESAAAAQRAINYRGAGNSTVVVGVKINLDAVLPHSSGQPVPLGRLSEALAEANRQHIEQALQQADIASIRRRLAELEGPAEAPPSPRKKM